MGDPAGIGPGDHRQGRAAPAGRIDAGDLRLMVIGSGAALERRAARSSARRARHPRGHARTTRDWPALCLPAGRSGGRADPAGPCSRPTAAASPISPIERGVRLAQAGRIGGIVTAPLNKEALNKAGYHYPGHTEMLAELTGVRGSVMLLAHGNMRVSHVTTHIALEDVPKRLTPERLRRVIDLTHDALIGLGVPRAPHRRRRAQPACRRGRPVRPAGHRRLRADHRQGGRGRARRRRPGSRATPSS